MWKLGFSFGELSSAAARKKSIRRAVTCSLSEPPGSSRVRSCSRIHSYLCSHHILPQRRTWTPRSGLPGRRRASYSAVSGPKHLMESKPRWRCDRCFPPHANRNAWGPVRRILARRGEGADGGSSLRALDMGAKCHPVGAKSREMVAAMYGASNPALPSPMSHLRTLAGGGLYAAPRLREARHRYGATCIIDQMYYTRPIFHVITPHSDMLFSIITHPI